MAFSKELEDIIEAALADGVITEKERAVLHKKALLEGVDPEEVDVVVDGRLQQKYNEVEAAKQKIRKCPSCGELIPAMTAVCPNCGQVVDTSNSDNKALQEYMDKLEAALVKLKENGASKYDNKVKAELEGMIRQGRSLYGDNKKIAYLISEVEASIVKFDKAHRNHLIMKIIAVIIAVLFFGGRCVKSNLEASAAEEKAEAQYTELCKQLDALEPQTEDNFMEVQNSFLKITWKDIPGDKSNYKQNYLEKKRNLAEGIIGVGDPSNIKN